ncbi:MAG: hypothetical protein R2851_28710 [Caldilineaceae bacterium]
MIPPGPRRACCGAGEAAAVIASAPPHRRKVVTLCTGARSPASMSGVTIPTTSPEAWRDLLANMGTALAVAAEHGVMLAVEPEVSNVMSSPPEGPPPVG